MTTLAPARRPARWTRRPAGSSSPYPVGPWRARATGTTTTERPIAWTSGRSPTAAAGGAPPVECPSVVADVGALRAVDEGVARRLKALACTAPLHDLDARKSRLDWVDASRYQMAEIALQAIDQVTLAMDFDHGADQAEIV